MSPLRRAALLTTVCLTSLAGLAASASATVRSVARAPGRVAFPVDGGLVADNVDGGGVAAAVALPGGGALAVGSGYAAELNADGSLNPAFGDGGVARIGVGVAVFRAGQILRQPDAGFVVAGAGAPANKFQHPQMVLRRFNVDGSIDPSFGTAGTAALPIQASCAGCHSVALLPGGGFLVAGNTGQASPAIVHDPNAVPETQWVVARLTSTGALDPSFGTGGLVTLPETGAVGYTVTGLASGDILTTGHAGRIGQLGDSLARLLPSGALDPTFAGGAPVALPASGGFATLGYPDGSAAVGLDGGVARFTAAGALDPAFGSGGVAHTGTNPFAELLPAPGGGVLAVSQSVAGDGQVHIVRVAANGAVDPTVGGPAGLSLVLPFGGGSSSVLVSQRPRPLPPLAQDSFRGGTFIQRPDGSFLSLGGVLVSQPTGEGTGRSIFDFAAAALTPAFAPDPSFGGPAIPLRAALRVPAQRAVTARTRRGIRVVVSLSAPGLARVLVRAGGQAVARSVVPVFKAGPATLPVELTSYGDAFLRGRHRVSLRVSATARDLLANTATATAGGALR